MARESRAKFKGVQWRSQPDESDYPNAVSYLSLVLDKKHSEELGQKLRDADVEQFKAKDIFRASTLPLLPITNAHVQQDLKKIHSGKSLSPLLLVRMPKLAKVVIADGYHRLCAVYSLDEDAVIPCKIV